MWITALCHVIKRLASDCRNPINNTIDSDALSNLVYALSALVFLSYRVPIRQLLSLPSIQLRSILTSRLVLKTWSLVTVGKPDNNASLPSSDM